MKTSTLTTYLLVLALGSFSVACGKKSGSSGGNDDSNYSNVNVGGLIPASELDEIKEDLANKTATQGLSNGQTFRFIDINGMSQSTFEFLGIDLNFSWGSSFGSPDCEFIMVLPNGAIESGEDDCNDYTPEGLVQGIYDPASDPELMAFMGVQAGSVAQIRRSNVVFQSKTYAAYVVDVKQGFSNQITKRYVVSPKLPLLLNPIVVQDMQSGAIKYLEGALVQ